MTDRTANNQTTKELVLLKWAQGGENFMGRFKCFAGSEYSHNMLIEEVIIPQPNSHPNWDISAVWNTEETVLC